MYKDKGKLELHELITVDSFLDNGFFIKEKFDKLLAKKAKRPKPDQSGVWDAQTASIFFNSAREIVEEEIKSKASRFSSVEWLWYLRRLPRLVFEGSLSSTFGYDRTLAEVNSHIGSAKIFRRSIDIEKNQITYRVTPLIARDIVRFCLANIYLSQIHTDLRLTGKGVQYRFASKAYPERIANTDVEEAIRLYDERNATYGGFFASSGTLVSETADDSTDYRHLILCLAIAPPDTIRPMIFEKNTRATDIEYGFIPSVLSLERLVQLKSDYRLREADWPAENVSAIMILLKLLLNYLVHSKGSRYSLVQFGYFIAIQEDFSSFFKAYLPIASKIIYEALPTIKVPNSPRELFQILESFNGRSWPLRSGPIVRKMGNVVQIDLFSASIQLERLLEFPRITGPLPSAKSEHFEKVVQSIINQTKWSPSSQVGNYRGRTLRLNQQRVTDIDAIGEFNSRLLLVSCKSYIYNEEYDAGNYRVVRNIATDVENAVSDWANVINNLNRNPKGDNYDFSSYSEILGVVCTPHTFYVQIGTATDFVADKLRAAVSIFELEAWLKDEV